MVEDGFRCPLENCRKLFRRDNLLLMHIKHYHPALLKKLGCDDKTLRVEDLAAARTAFESEDIKPPSSMSNQSILSALLTPLQPQQLHERGQSPAPSPSPSLSASTTTTRAAAAAAAAAAALAANTSTPLAAPVAAPASDPAGVVAPADLSRVPLSKRLEMSAAKNQTKKAQPVEPDPRDAEDAAPPPLTDTVANNKESTPTPTTTTTPVTAAAPPPAVVVEEKKELVHCFCNSPEEDGLMIQCELCLCWQHGYCLGIQCEQSVPDPYVCQFCRYPYRERLSKRHTHDQSWLNKSSLATLKFVSGSPFVVGDRSLSIANSITSAANELKHLLHSLKVKIDIAK